MIDARASSIRARSRARYLAASALCAAFSATACDAILGVGDDKLPREEDASIALDAAVPDVAHASDASAPPPDALPPWCGQLGVPEVPAQDDDGGTDRTVYLAFNNVDFGDHANLGTKPVTGLNLDHACTCPMPETCTPRVNDAGHCDIEAGIDNGANTLLSFYATFQSPLDDLVNAEISAGNFSMLLRIAKYNGLANDSDVELSFFTSSGTPVDDAGVHALPVYDGGGVWELDPTSTYGGDGGAAIPKYKAEHAYVSHHVLVADMGNFPISFGGFGDGTGINVGLKLDMKMNGVVITGTLADDGAGGFRIDDGVLAGRWSTRSIILAIGSLPSQLTVGKKICEDTIAFPKLRDLVCGAADIAFDRTHDSTQPPWACNAVSVGMRFTSSPVVFGGYGAAAEAGTPCESLLDPQNADCP